MLTSHRQTQRSVRAKEESLNARYLALAAAGAGSAAALRLLTGAPTIEKADDAVVFLASVAAIVIGSWWCANVAAWTVALHRGHTLGRFTLPGTKGLAQLLLAVSLSSACVADTDEGPSMVLVEVVDAPDDAGTVPDPPSTSSRPPSTSSLPPTTSSLPPATTATTLASSTTVTNSEHQSPDPELAAIDADADRALIEGSAVVSGDGNGPTSIPAHRVIVQEHDNLWSLSQEALESHGLESPACDVIASYWRQVVAGNRVGSGNADLIVPGEAIEMPAFELAA